MSTVPALQSHDFASIARRKLQANAMIQMWSSTRMIVLTAAVAALYASAEIVLQSAAIVIIPGVTAFEVSDVLTMLLGVLFGPAGAWGVAIGNVFGDLFTGGLGLGSGFGFLSSMAVAYVGFAMWRYFSQRWKFHEYPTTRRLRPVLTYLACGIPAAGASAVVLAWGLELLGIAPYKIISDTLVANFIIGNWAGAILFFLIYDRFRSMNLTWDSIMSEADQGASKLFPLGALLVMVGSYVGWPLGAFILPGNSIRSVTSVFFALIVVGCMLL